MESALGRIRKTKIRMKQQVFKTTWERIISLLDSRKWRYLKTSKRNPEKKIASSSLRCQQKEKFIDTWGQKLGADEIARSCE